MLGDDKTIVWLHLPKTAGKSLIAEIERMGVPFRQVYGKVETLDQEAFFAATRSWLAALRESMVGAPVRVIIGHFTKRDFTAVFGDDPRFVFATMLRDPIERMASHYFFMTAQGNPQSEAIRKMFPTLQSALDNPMACNIMARFLEDSPGEKADLIVRRLREDFHFVGRLETYDADFRRFAALLGHERAAQERRNVNPSKPQTIPQSQRDRIAELNDRDCAIYRGFVEAQTAAAARS